MIRVAVVYHSETGNTRAMADLICEGALAAGAGEARAMSVDDVDEEFLGAAQVALFGSPTYEGTCSWQMKRYLDEVRVKLAGKLGGAFASQNWPGGGGADLAEITILAALLVRGMLVYAGGISVGMPPLHFGAVSTRAPKGFDADRCRKLGENFARKAAEIFE